jgi:drug/metabolite transporter (DMT)-like permease
MAFAAARGAGRVTVGIAAAVLAAALLHASWQALVKVSGDGVVALAGMNLVSGAVALSLLPFVALPTPAAALIIAASLFLHAGYKITLASLYARAELSVGYPLARGLTPVFAALLALVFLGEVPGHGTTAGVLAIAAGIAILVRRWVSAASLGAAVAVGLFVASYSTLDAYGVRINGDWLGFTAWLIAADSAMFVAYARVTRGRKATVLWRGAWGRTLVSGLLGLASFAVFMWALARAQVGAVAALRETSIVFAAAIGSLALKERMTQARAVSTALVAGGAAAIALVR